MKPDKKGNTITPSRITQKTGSVSVTCTELAQHTVQQQVSMKTES